MDTSSKKHLKTAIMITASILVVVALYINHSYSTITSEHQNMLTLLIEKFPSLKPQYDAAMKDGKITYSEFNAIIESDR